MSIGVLLADDGERAGGLRMILESEAGIEAVGEAANDEQARPRPRRLRPDFVLLEFRCPAATGCRPRGASPRTPSFAAAPARQAVLLAYESGLVTAGA